MLIDSHVHLFPPRVFAAIWRWFDRHAWNVAHRIEAEEIVGRLVAAGVDRLVGLCYSHVPDMARDLNRFMADLGRAHAAVIPFGTVLPGEPDEAAIIDEALRLGLRGFKLHCHVQKLTPDDARLDYVYRRAADAGVPVVIHAGRAPCLEGYGVDPAALCDVAATRRMLERHPRLTMIVPHLGADQEAAHFALLDQFPNLYLDTTMAVAGGLGPDADPAPLARHAERILFGTDFPNIPYGWRHELDWLRAHVPEPALGRILGGNAARLFGC